MPSQHYHPYAMSARPPQNPSAFLQFLQEQYLLGRVFKYIPQARRAETYFGLTRASWAVREEVYNNKPVLDLTMFTVRDMVAEDAEDLVIHATALAFSHNANDELVEVVCRRRAMCTPFPLATVDITFCHAISNESFADFKGVRHLKMSCCRQSWITGRALEHLAGVKELDMYGCSQMGIASDDFGHLAGVKKLDIRGTCKRGSKILPLLAGRIKKLYASGLDFLRLPQDFTHLRGIADLDVSGVDGSLLDEEAFKCMRGVRKLVMNNIRYSAPGLTPAALAAIKGVQDLSFAGSSDLVLTDAHFRELAGVRILSISFCKSLKITNSAFVHLAGLKHLDMAHAVIVADPDAAEVTAALFLPLRGISVLQLPERLKIVTDEEMEMLADVPYLSYFSMLLQENVARLISMRRERELQPAKDGYGAYTSYSYKGIYPTFSVFA